jgi:hypothetical protein
VDLPMKETCELTTCSETPTVTGCQSDFVFVLSAMIGAVVGAILGVLTAPYVTGGEYAEMFGALGAMLGSGLLATATCVPQRAADRAGAELPVAVPTSRQHLAG